MQLELPATKVPSESSHPHSPVEGLSMQFVPQPLDSPSSLQEIENQHAISKVSAGRKGDLPPEESPVVSSRLHLRTVRCCTGVRAASAVRRTVNIVVLVIGLEHGESLIGHTGVICALGGLDGGGDFASAAARRRRIFALGVARGLVEGSEDHGRASQQSEKLCKMHSECQMELKERLVEDREQLDTTSTSQEVKTHCFIIL